MSEVIDYQNRPDAIHSIATQATSVQFNDWKQYVQGLINEHKKKGSFGGKANGRENPALYDKSKYLSMEDFKIPFYLYPSFVLLNTNYYEEYYPIHFVEMFLNQCDKVIQILFSDIMETFMNNVNLDPKDVENIVEAFGYNPLTPDPKGE